MSSVQKKVQLSLPHPMRCTTDVAWGPMRTAAVRAVHTHHASSTETGSSPVPVMLAVTSLAVACAMQEQAARMQEQAARCPMMRCAREGVGELLAVMAGSHGCAQVDEVKGIMVDNIEKVLERGEKIELLVDKTDNLRFQVPLLFLT